VVQGSKAGKRKIDKAIAFDRPVLTEKEGLWVLELIKRAYSQ